MSHLPEGNQKRARLAIGLLLATCGVQATLAQEPIPEPDAIYFGAITGPASGFPVMTRISVRNDTVQLDAQDVTSMNAGPVPFVLRVPLANPVNGAVIPITEVGVDKLPKVLKVFVGETAQGTVSVIERGAIYRVDFAFDATGAHADTPLPQIPQGGGGVSTFTATATRTATRTSTPTRTATCTPTSTPTFTPTPSPTPQCAGDCNGDHGVTINELILLINEALGQSSPEGCIAGDTNRDGHIQIGEIIRAVNSALNGCDRGG